MIPIEIEGRHYRSIAAAWKAESPPTLKEITVRLRLRNGWPVDQALLVEPVPATDRRTFPEVRNK